MQPRCVYLQKTFISPYLLAELEDSWEKLFIPVEIAAEYPGFNIFNLKMTENVPGAPSHSILIVVNKIEMMMKLYDANYFHCKSNCSLSKRCFQEILVDLKQFFIDFYDLKFRIHVAFHFFDNNVISDE